MPWHSVLLSTLLAEIQECRPHFQLNVESLVPQLAYQAVLCAASGGSGHYYLLLLEGLRRLGLDAHKSASMVLVLQGECSRSRGP